MRLIVFLCECLKQEQETSTETSAEVRAITEVAQIRATHSESGEEEPRSPQLANDTINNLVYDQETNSYRTTNLKKGLEELGVRLGTVLVLQDVSSPNSRHRIYRCIFSRKKLPTRATRKRREEMFRRIGHILRVRNRTREGSNMNRDRPTWCAAKPKDLA